MVAGPAYSSPESPQFVHCKIPDKNATGGNHLGEYVFQTQDVEAETHYDCIEKKTGPHGQAEHNHSSFVSGRGLECDSAVQVIVETDADQVADNRGDNRVESEPLHE